MSEKRTNPLTILIVCGVFVLALAAILVFGLGGGESRTGGSGAGSSETTKKEPPKDLTAGQTTTNAEVEKKGAEPTQPATPPKKEPPKDLTAGQTITRAEVEEQGVELAQPAAPVDTNRIAMTYKQGSAYRTRIKTGIESRGSYTDWGITTDMNIKFLGEFEFLRNIERNDGNQLVVILEFTKLESIELYTQVDSISLDLGNVAHTVLDLAGAAFDIPPGASRIATDQLNKIISSKLVRNELSKAIRDNTAQLFTWIDSLSGKKCRVVFENGKGVVSIQPIGCTLSQDEYAFVMDMAMLSDIFFMPDEECKEGDTWEIRGEDFLPIIDPSMRASLTGMVTVRRGKDVGVPQEPSAVIRLERGVLELRNRDDKTELAARWAPRGELEYSFGQQIVTSGRLVGDLSIVSRSIDHVIFEMNNTITPEYEITYHCEIIK
jgi:hypothetical protein